MKSSETDAYAQGFDEGVESVRGEIVCSICGMNHDRDESAACDGCEPMRFDEWATTIGGRASQLEHERDECVKGREAYSRLGSQARREADEWKREAELSKWPKEAAQEYHRLKVDYPQARREADQLRAAVDDYMNAQISRDAKWQRESHDRLRAALAGVQDQKSWLEMRMDSEQT